MKEKLRVFEAFAGDGGASFGLKKAKIKHEVIGKSEFDKYALEIFELNHPKIKAFGDITLINPKDLPDFVIAVGIPAKPIKKFNFQSQKWEKYL